MVSDHQVRRLRKFMQTEKTKELAASKAGMDRKTARKYESLDKLPVEVKAEHTWRTRKDVFADVWEGVCDKLSLNWGLEAKTLFEDLQRRYPGRFGDGQLRSLQRRIKIYRALEGPPPEVFFPQVHHPGRLCQSDFTDMSSLGITIAGVPFDHLLYHFVLPYSNWETATICFSESFESLSEGLQIPQRREGIGRGCAGSSERPFECGSAKHRQPQRLHPILPGAFKALRFGRPQDQRPLAP